MGYDWATKGFGLATSTLFVLFTAFQVFAVGLLADLFVRTSKPRDEVDPTSL